MLAHAAVEPIARARARAFDERALRLTADTGRSELVWNKDYELWCHGDVWLLLINRAQFITLPAADLSPEVKTALARQVTDHGGRVRGL
jgi:hypothetical protein